MTLTYHDAFKDKLQHLVNVHAPPTEKMMRGKPAPWFTFDIEVAINDRNHYLKVARRTNNKADWQLYHKSHNYVTYAIHKSKANYCKNLLTQTSHKPKDFMLNILLLTPFVCFSPQLEASFRTRQFHYKIEYAKVMKIKI